MLPRRRGDSVRYVAGCAEAARLYFIDGGMAHVKPERYELLDLDSMFPVSPPQ